MLEQSLAVSVLRALYRGHSSDDVGRWVAMVWYWHMSHEPALLARIYLLPIYFLTLIKRLSHVLKSNP
jgi:hypothetical protein